MRTVVVPGFRGVSGLWVVPGLAIAPLATTASTATRIARIPVTAKARRLRVLVMPLPSLLWPNGRWSWTSAPSRDGLDLLDDEVDPAATAAGDGAGDAARRRGGGGVR